MGNDGRYTSAKKFTVDVVKHGSGAQRSCGITIVAHLQNLTSA